MRRDSTGLSELAKAGFAGLSGARAALGEAAELSGLPAEDLLALMGQDKKAVAGRLRFVLARRIGEAFVTGDVPEAAVLETLRAAA